MYTQFVSEQLAAVDEFGDLEAVPTGKGAGQKRKADGDQGGQPKKACPDTKVCNPPPPRPYCPFPLFSTHKYAQARIDLCTVNVHRISKDV